MNFLQQSSGSQSAGYFAQPQPAFPAAPVHHRSSFSFSNDASQSLFSSDDFGLLGYEDGHDHGDPKRRRIARVRFINSYQLILSSLTTYDYLGL
jgi:hypothetical protein